MSTEPEAPLAFAPGEGPEILDRLLERLNGHREDKLREAFARAYVRRSPAVLRGALSVDELAAQVAGAYAFVDARAPGELALRVWNPTREADGWQAAGTVIEANVEDAPFLVDTVTNELRRHGLEVRLVVHPVIGATRREDGHLATITPARGAQRRESIMHFEVDRRLSGRALERLSRDLERVLGELRLAVRDFLPMVRRVECMIEAAEGAGGRYDAEDVHEAVEFLQWLTEDNFIFLGYREYAIRGEAEEAEAFVVDGSGLGILSDTSGSALAKPLRIASLAAGLRGRILEGPLVIVSKTNRETTIHRRSRLDYIGVKRVSADGAISGELRLLGLFTSKAEMEPAHKIPLARKKLERIMRAEDLFPGSHDYKAIVTLFDSFPHDELFGAAEEAVRPILMQLLAMQDGRGVGRGVRLFAHTDVGRRVVWAVVALPVDHASPEVRARLAALFEARFDAVSVESAVVLAEEPGRIHYMLHVAEGEVPDVDLEALAREVADVARTWDDRLSDALSERFAERRGHELARRYAAVFPEYYKTATSVKQAAFDIEQLEALGPDRPYVVALQNEQDAAEPLTRLKLMKLGGKAPLSDVLSLLEQLGLTVVEEVPTRLPGGDGGRYIHDFGVLGPDGRALDLQALSGLVADAFAAVWEGRVESDSLQRLVTCAGLTWRQVAILRAYREYRRLLGTTFTIPYQNDAFIRNAELSRKLVALFEARFDPAQEDDGARAAELEREIVRDLDAVASLDDDRILRGFLGVILATVRTNAYVDEGRRPHLSFKLRCEAVPGMPKPVPLYEIFVYSPRVAAVHLRGGMVARGGIRWSDRLEDYRTEVLGLMKAQMVKNAVIVPVGAKGGFVLKRPPAERPALLEEERRQYVTFMRGMLEITDNIVGHVVRRPAGVRAHDGDDPYLVVAADKGTAHLSDTANAVSADVGFWLDDAFASGGSSGYDHKALGITAKGAWESVKRHFRELGRDVMTQPFTAVGIGDMSGDVFGNGMLLSPETRLVAAFDHRHVFLDPDPDAAVSLRERRRLYELAGSSWDDYDRDLISEGGGVWPRTAKSIRLSPQAREALGVEAEKLPPAELIQAILRAPVDLFWNGGIGTFVKASDETHADAGDRTNDAIRVNARELRCRVVAEGGNLGLTQRARVEYARNGGRVNTDAIDNSAGVDCSDHEVNLKILLGIPRAAGELSLEERNRLLDEVADDVVAHVLYDNYLQVQIISQETAVAAERMEAYEEIMAELEARGVLERQLESLPSTEEMGERRSAGEGLTRPELCVLLAYAKRLLREQVLPSSLPDDPWLERALEEYFPRRVLERYRGALGAHPLRREIVATVVTNDVVNSMGISFVRRMVAETGATADQVARAFLVAREISDARRHWDEVERLDGVIAPELQNELMTGVDALVEQLARWYLRHVPDLGLASEIETGRPQFTELAEGLARMGTSRWRAACDERLARLRRAGVPEEPARFCSVAQDLVYAPDIMAVARETSHSLADVAHAFFLVGERLYLDVIEDRVAELPARSRWQRLAWTTMADDLRLLRRQIATRVIEQSAGASIGEAVDRYLSARVDPYQRLARLMETFSHTPEDDTALIMVIVHQIRQVVA